MENKETMIPAFEEANEQIKKLQENEKKIKEGTNRLKELLNLGRHSTEKLVEGNDKEIAMALAFQKNQRREVSIFYYHEEERIEHENLAKCLEENGEDFDKKVNELQKEIQERQMSFFAKICKDQADRRKFHKLD